MKFCDRCGIRPPPPAELTPLEGTQPEREFCPHCVGVVTALAARLSECGAPDDQILRHISLRYNRQEAASAVQ